MEWSIQEVARLAGTTSRTLRHYDAVGLLRPSSIGPNGYRRYDQEALTRLQRILLLRDLGLGLPEIRRVLEAQTREVDALTTHLELLAQQRQRLDRQMKAVEHTISALEGKELLMAEQMFDGFDHTEHREEVEERWGKSAYRKSNQWYNAMSNEEKKAWHHLARQLGEDWIAAANDPALAPDADAAQAIAARHVDWLRGIPGTPAGEPGGDLAGYLLGLGEMYVADERFAANYGGVEGASFVRDALKTYVQRNLAA